jgi:hypothetical protein
MPDMDIDLLHARWVLGLLPEGAFQESGRPPLARGEAAVRVAREVARRLLRGQISAEQGATEIFDLVRRCGAGEVPGELKSFESWTVRAGDNAALSPEYAQAIVEWAWEMANQNPGL